ncbi:MAG TPA: hypothetical protein QGH10_20675 [Armatimonadota bacterium]|nr:hypothetical protein [Armatimonadota bacterium]
MSDKGIPVQEIGELFDMLGDKAPKIISELIQAVYSENTGRELGKATGAFYKELVDAGIPKEDALEMAKDYVRGLRDAMSSAKVHGGEHGGHGHAKHSHLGLGEAGGEADADAD